MCYLTLLPASFPGASPELLRMSINTGLIGSTVVQNIEQHLTAVKNVSAPYTLMKKTADDVFSSKYTYTTEVYFFVWSCGLHQGVHTSQESAGPLS